MKRFAFLRYFLPVLVLLAASNYSKSQPVPLSKQGEIVYSLVLISHNSPTIANTSQQMSIRFKGEKWTITTETNYPGLGKMTTLIIYDPKKNKSRSFFNMYGKKFELVMTPEEKKEALKNDAGTSMFVADSTGYNFKNTDSAEYILGHLCKKYTGSNTFSSATAYSCDSLYIPSGAINGTQIGSKGLNIFKGINGGILKCIMDLTISGIKMKYTIIATKITYEPVKDSEFKVPGGYKKVTMKDFRKQMNKGF
jgi:hypothetical protein